jgi:ornithine cyclodeaminase/alanine dehydrogenase-like protein (mu-crystallin family)
MQIFDAAATRAALPFERLIPALRTMFARGCEVPPRHVHELAAGDGAGLTSLIVPAWLPGVAYAVEIVNIAAGNAARGLPALHASVLLHDAAAAADIVSCATLAREPVVHGSWLRAGTHLDLIGSFTPAMREADDEALRGARIYVDADEALAKSGELLGPMARGVFAAGEVQGTLTALCRGGVRGHPRGLVQRCPRALAPCAPPYPVLRSGEPCGGSTSSSPPKLRRSNRPPAALQREQAARGDAQCRL